ncbi:hypothetical protein [Streptomyces sp. NPDC013187]|uniref:hypothetical protein n=1 Tax=Streptomyces sp. NPDC013187 TaxID=3364865 RepID=UPI0036BF3FA0
MGPQHLSGSYQPPTDHLRFNLRIPDEFPFIDYEVRGVDDIPDRAVLIEEFLHRCQWAATPFGLVYRTAALVQTRIGLRILSTLAADPSLRLPTPWYGSDSRSLAAPLAGDLRTINALETLKRFLLGVPLGRPLDEFKPAVEAARQALIRLSPLSFGNFESWSPENVTYRPDGRPIMERTTRGIMESHASAYAIELLRSCSATAAAPWLDDYSRRNRVNLYKALDELTQAARLSLRQLPELDTRCLLQLADLAIGEQFADIPGLPPPSDYIESMLPYSRYETALKDVALSADALAMMEEQGPETYADMDDALRLRVIMRNALTIRGQASALLGTPVMSRRPVMLGNAAAARKWGEREASDLLTDGDLRFLEQSLVGGLTHTAVRFFLIQAETKTDTVLFEPTVERFTLLTRMCDWPVVEYADGLEVFLCDAMADPRPVVVGQITVFEVVRAVRMLLRQACTRLDDDAWRLSVFQRPLTEVAGARIDQLVSLT